MSDLRANQCHQSVSSINCRTKLAGFISRTDLIVAASGSCAAGLDTKLKWPYVILQGMRGKGPVKKNIQNFRAIGIGLLTPALTGQSQPAMARSIDAVDAVQIQRGSPDDLLLYAAAKAQLEMILFSISTAEKLKLGGGSIQGPGRLRIYPKGPLYAADSATCAPKASATCASKASAMCAPKASAACAPKASAMCAPK